MTGDGLDAVFSALADPTRRGLVTRLTRDGPRTATLLARDLPITRQAVVHHLQALGEAGLVDAAREGREVRYRATPGAPAVVAAGVGHRLLLELRGPAAPAAQRKPVRRSSCSTRVSGQYREGFLPLPRASHSALQGDAGSRSSRAPTTPHFALLTCR